MMALQLSSLAANLGLSNKYQAKYIMYHRADLHALQIYLITLSDAFKQRDTSVNTVNELFQKFQSVIESAMNYHIPTKIISNIIIKHRG